MLSIHFKQNNHKSSVVSKKLQIHILPMVVAEILKKIIERVIFKKSPQYCVTYWPRQSRMRQAVNHVISGRICINRDQRCVGVETSRSLTVGNGPPGRKTRSLGNYICMGVHLRVGQLSFCCPESWKPKSHVAPWRRPFECVSLPVSVCLPHIREVMTPFEE